ncbi:MAG: PaaI family thioesterase [Thermodesulfobacteriota bacterium]|nr:PaaI family thioesterase [Thermodesulfobacteriota bacterium]
MKRIPPTDYYIEEEMIYPKVEAKIESASNDCFGCGGKNPIGLKLLFERIQDGWVKSVFVPSEHHIGWPGVVHGGIIATLLDEAMGYVSYCEGVKALTAKMELRYFQPVKIGEKLIVTGRLVKRKWKMMETEGKLTRFDGTKVADATATMLIVD